MKRDQNNFIYNSISYKLSNERQPLQFFTRRNSYMLCPTLVGEDLGIKSETGDVVYCVGTMIRPLSTDLHTTNY